MVNYNFITERLATGGQLTDPSDVQALVSNGITHVIDCNSNENDLPLFRACPSITYLYNPTYDDGQPKPVVWFQTSLEFALPALALPYKRVYAHCAAGINRGPSTCYAIMRALGFTPADAISIIHAMRPITIGGIRYAPCANQAVESLGYGTYQT